MLKYWTIFKTNLWGWLNIIEILQGQQNNKWESGETKQGNKLRKEGSSVHTYDCYGWGKLLCKKLMPDLMWVLI